MIGSWEDCFLNPLVRLKCANSRHWKRNVQTTAKIHISPSAVNSFLYQRLTRHRKRKKIHIKKRSPIMNYKCEFKKRSAWFTARLSAWNADKELRKNVADICINSRWREPSGPRVLRVMEKADSPCLVVDLCAPSEWSWSNDPGVVILLTNSGWVSDQSLSRAITILAALSARTFQHLRRQIATFNTLHRGSQPHEQIVSLSDRRIN